MDLNGLGMPGLRRRFYVPGTWKFIYNGTVFTGASAICARFADTAHRNTTSYGFFDGENTY